MTERVLVLSGPNLNLLGSREPEVYGRTTLAEIVSGLERLGEELGVEVGHFQSNHEGALIDRVHQASLDGVRGAIVNAGGFTHTSVALRDALVGTGLPFVEVHLSNLARRESFRQVSLLADVACGVVQGFGPAGYELALRGLVRAIRAEG
ncbi:MAG: type II 3-dehydroquinate dehydratase [Myxococcota bacterium]